MYAIAFDLVVEDIRQHYNGPVAQAYRDVRNVLAPFAFYWVQGSVYQGDDNDLLKVTQAMNALKALHGSHGACVTFAPTGLKRRLISRPG